MKRASIEKARTVNFSPQWRGGLGQLLRGGVVVTTLASSPSCTWFQFAKTVETHAVQRAFCDAWTICIYFHPFYVYPCLKCD